MEMGRGGGNDVEPGRGVDDGGFRRVKSTDARFAIRLRFRGAGGGISREVRVSVLWDEFVRDSDGRSFSPSMLCKPKPLFLLCSAFSSFSSRSFSLFLLSAMRSLNDLIFGGSMLLVEFDLPGRFRLMSRAVRPLSMPSMTRAGLFGSSTGRLIRTGECGTWMSLSCLGSVRDRSSLRMPIPMVVLAREEAPSRSASLDVVRFLCSALSFNFASMACNLSWSVSSSSSPSLSACVLPRDMGCRFEGEGDGERELRSRRLSYFLRADGELRRASTDDCGGQFGWFSLT